jgi:hypothetical protein
MRCLENGVKTMEHNFMFDGDVARLMEEKGAYMTTNMQAFSPLLSEVSAISASPASARKAASAQKAFKDITVIGGNERWFDAPPRDGIETMRVIMKDGKIYKNTL